jgi:hypothetical protein
MSERVVPMLLERRAARRSSLATMPCSRAPITAILATTLLAAACSGPGRRRASVERPPGRCPPSRAARRRSSRSTSPTCTTARTWHASIPCRGNGCLTRTRSGTRSRPSVILPFVDNWPHWGGVTEYAAFRGKPLGTFFIDAELLQDFEATMDKVLLRTNTVNGRACRDNDPTVFAWETGNELMQRPAPGD